MLPNLSKCNHYLSGTMCRFILYRCNKYVGITRNSKHIAWSNHHHLLQSQTRCPLHSLNRYKNTATNEAAKVRIKRDSFMRLVQLVKSEKWILISGIGCLVISSGIAMSVPFALGKILDIIFNKDGTQSTEVMLQLKNVSIILCGVFLVGGLANFGRVYLFNTASMRIVRDLRSKLYKQMLSQEVGWFDQKSSGELINRLANDTYLVGNSLSQNLSDGLRSLVMTLAGTAMMIYTSAQLTLTSACVVPCLAGIAIIYGRYIRKITRILLDQLADISKTAEERLSNIKTVQIFCKENEELQRYDKLLMDTLKLSYKEAIAKATFFGMTGMSGNIIVLSVLYYGGTLVVNDSISIGALTSFLLYAGYTAISINGISNFYTELNKGVGSAHRIWEILDRPGNIPRNFGIVPKHKPYGNIVFEHVDFSFPSRPQVSILKQFSLNLESGKSTALVGRSGSGKTTIALLLLRLYDPNQGSIKLDNTDLRDLNPIWLRSNIGAVSQEPILFSGTIRENILYGLNPGESIKQSSFDEIVRQAHVDQFTQHFPDGLDTLVGQRGIMLSGGQRQRIAIARALIKNPAILIMDEATSALDSLSEQLVQNALEILAKGRTCLTIAHRLSTIRNADTIAVLDNGYIVESGSYAKLMSQVGPFKELVSKQALGINT